MSKMDGRLVYLWWAVDSEGEVLDLLVQTKRNNWAALKFMRKTAVEVWIRPRRARDRRSAVLRGSGL
jgi:transposase-like protein